MESQSAPSPFDRFLEALRDPEGPISVATVEALATEYPFFTLPAQMLLQREGTNLDNDLRRRLNTVLALNAPDPATLFRLIDRDSARWASFYPPEPRRDKVTTDDAISTFLENYGHSTPEEDALLEKLIFNPTPDYATMLAKEVDETPLDDPAESEAGSQDALINAFIARSVETPESLPEPTADDVEPETAAAQPEETPAVETPEAPAVKETPAAEPRPETPKNSLFSESLAKIYIKQRRYDKAYEIIHSLSLNFPEKSIYFADQLRFLKKLILNQQQKQ